MSEFIPYIPEHETTQERFAWDNILRALAILSKFDDDLDLYEAIHDLKDEEFEDGIMMVFNYAVMVTVPNNESSELEQVMQLLERYEISESTGDGQ